MKYEPNYTSLKQHTVPTWFDDAKLGIFVHWGLYSVPAWAPHGADIDKHVAEKGWESMFANNPYAEWYLNTLRISDNPTYQHHINTYGENFAYDDFAVPFNQAVEQWNPDMWADLFRRIGAQYVVLTTKHHDGFVLWPSARTSPHKPGSYGTKRDIVGELTNAVRKHGMRMGLYYSGGLDWSFNEKPVRGYMDVYSTIVQSPEFIEYVDFHWHELIERYAPSILWNDIGAPDAANLPDLFAYYYNTVAEGVINDRWRQTLPDRLPIPDEPINPPPAKHYDYTTPEYATFSEITEQKWEATRGIGHSFGYNQNEGVDDYLSVEELVRSFVDIVSKNGNLLLNVGPMSDGTIPELQRERLLGLGEWLSVNGEAIFGTRPWITAEGKTSDNIAVRYTQKANALYAVLLDTPASQTITLDALAAHDGTTISLLGYAEPLIWNQHEQQLTLTLPETLQPAPAHTIKFTPQPIRAS